MTAADAPEEEPRGEARRPPATRLNQRTLSIWLSLLALLLGLAVVLGGGLGMGGPMSPARNVLTVDIIKPVAERWTSLPCSPGDTGSASPSCDRPRPRAPVHAARVRILVQAGDSEVLVTVVRLEPYPQGLSLPPSGTPSPGSPWVSPRAVRLPARGNTDLLAPARTLRLHAGEAETFDITLVDSSPKNGVEPWVGTLCVRVKGWHEGRWVSRQDCEFSVLAHPGDSVSSQPPGTPSASPGP